ncbi:MAG: type II secretion system protein [bacterium]
MKTLSRRRAFTLVELMVAFAILGIVGMVVVPQYISTIRHTTDEVAQERADLLDLAKNEYQNGAGRAAFYYWVSATNDEAKYQLLRPYLRKGSPLQLGRGANSNDYTLQGYTYVLNQLTNATTVIRNLDGAAVAGPGASSSSGGGTTSSSGGTTSSSGSNSSSSGASNGATSSSGSASSSSSGTTSSSGGESSSSGGDESSSGTTSSSSSGGKDSFTDASSPSQEETIPSSREQAVVHTDSGSSLKPEEQQQQETNTSALAPEADASKHSKGRGGEGHFVRQEAPGERGGDALSRKQEEPWFHPRAERVVKESKPSFFDLEEDRRQKEGEKGFDFIPLPFRGFWGPVIFAAVLLAGLLLWWWIRRRKKKNDNAWRTLK